MNIQEIRDLAEQRMNRARVESDAYCAYYNVFYFTGRKDVTIAQLKEHLTALIANKNVRSARRVIYRSMLEKIGD